VPKKKPNQDRYLVPRGDVLFYRRRVPKKYREFDPRTNVERTTGTGDLAHARTLRDKFEIEDDRRWAALALGEQDADARHQAAIERAVSLGFRYKPAQAIAADSPLEEILARIAAIPASPAPVRTKVAEATLGLSEQPDTTIRQAFEIYIDRIEAGQRQSKSDGQYASWVKVKKRARSNFIAVVGDKPILQITREDALDFHAWWQERIENEGRKADTANREPPSLYPAGYTERRHTGREDVGNRCGPRLARGRFGEYSLFIPRHHARHALRHSGSRARWRSG